MSGGAAAPAADPIFADLARILAARQRAETAFGAVLAAVVGRADAEARYQAARADENDAMAAIFETQPTTPAAAAAVIRLAADHIDFVGLNDSRLVDSFTKAIRGAVELLERSAGA